MRSHHLLAALSLALLLAGTATSAAPGAASDWSTHLADAQGTAHSAGPGFSYPDVKWAHVIDDAAHNGRSHDVRGSVVIGPGGIVLIQIVDIKGAFGGGDDEDVLVALDPANGDELWRTENIDVGVVPVVDADGRIWVIQRVTPSDPSSLLALDATTGLPVQRTTFSDIDDNDGDPALSPVVQALRMTSDGAIVLRELSYGPQTIGSWLRAVDTAVSPPAQRFAVQLDDGENGPLGLWWEETRIGAAGEPNQDVVYLLHVTSGETKDDLGKDDDVFLVSVDPTTGAIVDEVELFGNQIHSFGDHSIVVAGSRIVVGTRGNKDEEPPAVADENLLGHLVAVDDDGSGGLSIAWHREAIEGTARDESDYRKPFDQLGYAGDGLVVGELEPVDGWVGIDLATGDKLWDVAFEETIDGYSSRFVVDAPGNVHSYDPFHERILSISRTGDFRYALDADDDVNDADPTVHTVLSTFAPVEAERFVPAAMDAAGTLYLTTLDPEDDGFDDITVVALEQGTPTVREAGPGRVETAVRLSKSMFRSAGSADVVVLARADKYPDALAGAPLAVTVGGPLLLTFPDSLHAVTAAEIQRLGATKVILLGGEAALSPQVEADLEAMGIDDIQRIFGPSRFETAFYVAEQIAGLRGGVSEIVVVEGANADPLRGWPDAVSASGFAARTGRPILLVERDRLPDATAATANDLGVDKAIIVGGTAAVSETVQGQLADLMEVDRIFGSGRYATSAMVADASVAAGIGLADLWIATGTAFPDALAAGAAAAFTDGVLMLVNGQNPDDALASYDFLAAHADDVGVLHIVGGTSAISTEVQAKIDATLRRP